MNPWAVLILGLSLVGPPVAAETVYVTWAGAEPDKGASLWYLLRHVTPGARVRIIEAGSVDLGLGIAVDTPQARYRRTHQLSTLESILLDHPTNDPTVTRLAAVIHDIEINLWRPKRFPESTRLEQAMLTIGARYQSNAVPIACFLAYFDDVYAWMHNGNPQYGPDIPGECDPQQRESGSD